VLPVDGIEKYNATRNFLLMEIFGLPIVDYRNFYLLLSEGQVGASKQSKAKQSKAKHFRVCGNIEQKSTCTFFAF